MGNGRKFALAAVLSLIAVNLASAGIVRHVVKPAVKGAVHVVAKTAKVVRTVAY